MTNFFPQRKSQGRGFRSARYDISQPKKISVWLVLPGDIPANLTSGLAFCTFKKEQKIKELRKSQPVVWNGTENHGSVFKIAGLPEYKVVRFVNLENGGNMKIRLFIIALLVLGFCTNISAQDKVVVIPLNSGNTAEGIDKQFQYNNNGNLAGADVYYDNTNASVGIGTTEPKYKMHLHENSSLFSYLTFTNDTTGSGSLDGVLVGIDPGEDFRIHTYEENNIRFYINNNEKLIITNSGHVGIGTNSPNTKLVIQGDGSHWSEGFLSLINENEDAGIRIYDGQNSVRYHIFNVNADNDLFRIVPADNYWEGIALQQDGNVGIGTLFPVTKLEVSSVIRLTPTDSPGTCDATTEGAMYYDDSLNEPCFCNGSSWVQFDGGGGC